jgi:hypothetical protein
MHMILDECEGNIRLRRRGRKETVRMKNKDNQKDRKIKHESIYIYDEQNIKTKRKTNEIKLLRTEVTQPSFPLH